MSKALKAEHLKILRPLEAALKQAVHAQEPKAAESAMNAIQQLLAPYGNNHHRLLECRLWYFESQFNANNVSTAESGFQSIVKQVNPSSRLFVESSFFLGLCFLRRKRILQAKTQFRLVFSHLNKITSAQTRHLLQKRIIERIEHESVLVTLIGTDEGLLKPDQIHDDAVKLLQKPEGELIELLARALPYGSIALFSDIRTDAFFAIDDCRSKITSCSDASNSTSPRRKISLCGFEARWMENIVRSEKPDLQNVVSTNSCRI